MSLLWTYITLVYQLLLRTCQKQNNFIKIDFHYPNMIRWQFSHNKECLVCFVMSLPFITYVWICLLFCPYWKFFKSWSNSSRNLTKQVFKINLFARLIIWPPVYNYVNLQSYLVILMNHSKCKWYKS